VLWAAHVVHHQSQDYNLSTACARPARARCWAGSSMCPWRWPACRRWCLAWWRWWTCSTSSGCTPSMWASWAGSTAGSAAPANHRVHHAVNDRVPGPQLRRHPDHLGPPLRQLQGRRREVRVRHPQAAEQLGPAVGQRRGVRGLRTTAGMHAAGRQAARVDQAAGLAAGRCGGAFSCKPAFSMAQMQIFHPPMSRAVQWFGAGAVCSSRAMRPSTSSTSGRSAPPGAGRG
jgi:alkylglycerol monooxygenase